MTEARRAQSAIANLAVRLRLRNSERRQRRSDQARVTLTAINLPNRDREWAETRGRAHPTRSASTL